MNKMKPLATALVALGSIGIGASALADSAVDAKIQELERQLQELKSQVSAQQQEIATNKTEMQAEIDEARPMAKGTKFTYGGYIQLDAIHSEYSEGKPNNLIEEANPVALPNAAAAQDAIRVIRDEIRTRMIAHDGPRMIAEAVESKEIFEELRLIGVDYAQGFGIAAPRPLSVLEAEPQPRPLKARRA